MSSGANEQLRLVKENYKLRAKNHFPKKLSEKVNIQAIGQYYKYLKKDGEEVQILQIGENPFIS